MEVDNTQGSKCLATREVVINQLMTSIVLLFDSVKQGVRNAWDLCFCMPADCLVAHFCTILKSDCWVGMNISSPNQLFERKISLIEK